MTNNTTLSYRLRLILVIVLPLALVILVSVMTGDFAPLQSSRITEFGICTQDTSYEPVRHLQVGIEKLWLCGILDGSTKRYVTFTMYYNNQGVSRRTLNLGPGGFFAPIQASELYFMNASRFPQGDYHVTFAYARDPVDTVRFSVGM